MRALRFIPDRLLFAIVVIILAVSTGAAAASYQGAQAITGHTAHITILGEPGDGRTRELPPVSYGLAIYREEMLFGVWERTRPLDEGANRMVFAWAGNAPDPRADTTLTPSGDFAVVRDEAGHRWIVHEFVYMGDRVMGESPYYAYGVLIGPTRDRAAHDPPPASARYNYALTYRLDKMFPEPVAAAGSIPPAQPIPPESIVLDPAILDPADPVTRVRSALPAEPAKPPSMTVRFGLGVKPEQEAFDPAKIRWDLPA